jgi:hypothetical protein
MSAQSPHEVAKLIDEVQAAAESDRGECPSSSTDRFRLLREIGQINRPRHPPHDEPGEGP